MPSVFKVLTVDTYSSCTLNPRHGEDVSRRTNPKSSLHLHGLDFCGEKTTMHRLDAFLAPELQDIKDLVLVAQCSYWRSCYLLSFYPIQCAAEPRQFVCEMQAWITFMKLVSSSSATAAAACQLQKYIYDKLKINTTECQGEKHPIKTNENV